MNSGNHPFGIRPLGDVYLLTPNLQIDAHRCRLTGLGTLSILDDEALLHLVFGSGFLIPTDFARLAQCSKVLAAFSLHDDLYRANVLKEFGSDCLQLFCGNWRTTYINQKKSKVMNITNQSKENSLQFLCKGVYSDLLFQSWACYASSIPNKWWSRDALDSLPRHSATTLSMDDFINNFERPNIPVVITDCVSKWKAYKEWTFESLKSRFGKTKFHVAGYDIFLSNYLDYLSQGACDADQPLYLFDKDFAIKSPDLVKDYTIPLYFSHDLFNLLSEYSFTEEMTNTNNHPKNTCIGNGIQLTKPTLQDICRPDHRWLIIGPKKSGSVFHKDPNKTSAWNACIRGKKKWILFPPHITPPGVFPSEDGGAVETPVSVMEWFLNFYKRSQTIIRQSNHTVKGGGGGGGEESYDKSMRLVPMEGVVNEGELIYVPRGWWHCVLNLEDSIAITHNFCSPRGLPEVLHCLKEVKHTISGVPEAHVPLLYDAFRKVLLQHEPELLKQVEGDNEKRIGEEERDTKEKMIKNQECGNDKEIKKMKLSIPTNRDKDDIGRSTEFVLSSLWE